MLSKRPAKQDTSYVINSCWRPYRLAYSTKCMLKDIAERPCTIVSAKVGIRRGGYKVAERVLTANLGSRFGGHDGVGQAVG